MTGQPWQDSHDRTAMTESYDRTAGPGETCTVSFTIWSLRAWSKILVHIKNIRNKCPIPIIIQLVWIVIAIITVTVALTWRLQSWGSQRNWKKSIEIERKNAGKLDDSSIRIECAQNVFRLELVHVVTQQTEDERWKKILWTPCIWTKAYWRHLKSKKT